MQKKPFDKCKVKKWILVKAFFFVQPSSILKVFYVSSFTLCIPSPSVAGLTVSKTFVIGEPSVVTGVVSVGKKTITTTSWERTRNFFCQAHPKLQLNWAEISIILNISGQTLSHPATRPPTQPPMKVVNKSFNSTKLQFGWVSLLSSWFTQPASHQPTPNPITHPLFHPPTNPPIRNSFKNPNSTTT